MLLVAITLNMTSKIDAIGESVQQSTMLRIFTCKLKFVPHNFAFEHHADRSISLCRNSLLVADALPTVVLYRLPCVIVIVKLQLKIASFVIVLLGNCVLSLCLVLVPLEFVPPSITLFALELCSMEFVVCKTPVFWTKQILWTFNSYKGCQASLNLHQIVFQITLPIKVSNNLYSLK